MFRYKFFQFMQNKYGNDKLNTVLLIASVVLAFLNLFFNSVAVYFIQLLCLVFFFVRFFSTNVYQRTKENDAFLRFISKFKRNKTDDFNTVYSNEKIRKEKGYKYFKCHNCSAKLRVPKGKGKITITCPKCRASFKGRS